jgi:uncharacterized protein YecT (DUF1311 family)
MSYDRAIDAAKGILDRGIKMDFRPKFEESQKQWTRWAEVQCQLESILTMGSAEAYVGSMCLDRLTRERSRSLDALAKSLEPPTWK